MGNQKSNPKTEQNGDSDITIINNQDQHTEMLLAHEWKIVVILVIVGLQLAVTLYVLFMKREKRRASKIAARSIAALNQV
ncbi:hypothetical protein RP20_CCG002782 [Aedes albopictus]|nr:hypothetical protein RP20_CCG005906 [Aedes albopictus]KXJ30270.1 hypothetical protein RP20_CCG002782 [Aedes albopictus]